MKTCQKCGRFDGKKCFQTNTTTIATAYCKDWIGRCENCIHKNNKPFCESIGKITDKQCEGFVN